MCKEYSFELSPEERLAFDIWQCIDGFNTEQKGFSSLEFDKEILNDLNFEVVNDFYEKFILISYVIKSDTSINKIEFHLMTLGINRKFTDKSNSKGKKYLAVWV